MSEENYDRKTLRWDDDDPRLESMCVAPLSRLTQSNERLKAEISQLQQLLDNRTLQTAYDATQKLENEEIKASKLAADLISAFQQWAEDRDRLKKAIAERDDLGKELDHAVTIGERLTKERDQWKLDSKVNAKLADQRFVQLQRALAALPVGYIPDHTAENLPTLIAHWVVDAENSRRTVTALNAYIDRCKDSEIAWRGLAKRLVDIVRADEKDFHLADDIEPAVAEYERLLAIDGPDFGGPEEEDGPWPEGWLERNAGEEVTDGRKE